MPGRDYRLLKAQCWQESRFNPNAVSPANARGICQFVDGTWNDVSNETGFRGSPYDADLHITFPKNSESFGLSNLWLSATNMLWQRTMQAVVIFEKPADCVVTLKPGKRPNNACPKLLVSITKKLGDTLILFTSFIGCYFEHR
jgi:hypothetical protein